LRILKDERLARREFAPLRNMRYRMRAMHNVSGKVHGKKFALVEHWNEIQTSIDRLAFAAMPWVT